MPPATWSDGDERLGLCGRRRALVGDELGVSGVIGLGEVDNWVLSVSGKRMVQMASSCVPRDDDQVRLERFNTPARSVADICVEQLQEKNK